MNGAAHIDQCSDCRTLISGAAATQASPGSTRPEGSTSRQTSVLGPGAAIDHFEVVRLLGRGGMGDVYLARDTKLGRHVALKLVSAALHDSSWKARFIIEAKATARCSHPNIITIHAIAEHNGAPYLALEYVDGRSLASLLSDGARLSEVATRRYGLAIAEALVEAHSHAVWHRDLKPENVLLGEDGRVRVADFGLAKMAHDDDVPFSTRAPQSLDAMSARGAGTPHYMAPECLIGGTGRC